MIEERYEVSATARLVMGAVSLIFGLFIVFAAPFILQMTYEAVWRVVLTAGGTPPPPPNQYYYTPFVVPMFFYFYRAIGIVGGISCIITSYSLWKGKSWAWPVTMLGIALPTIFSVLSVIPHMAHVGGMPPSIWIIVAGLFAYWIVLLFPRSGKIEKAAKISVFTLLGLLAGEAAVFCMQGTKALGSIAEMSYVANSPGPVLNEAIKIFGFSWPLQIATVIMCVLSIYLLAKRNPKGWWLGLGAGVTGMIANFPTQIIRMRTVDFLFTGILALLLVVALMIPAFKKKLIGENE
jgi:hypothetical protein